MQNQEKENQMGNSRILKFRAWDLDEKKMFLIDKLSEAEWVLYLGDAIKGKGKPVWMQYTGLKDKNGKEIYEFDILKVYGNNLAKNPQEVKWAFDCFSYYPLGVHLNNSDVEVIGNRFENPELLN